MVAGKFGIPEGVSVLAVLVPQALPAVTDKVPFKKFDGILRIMLVPLLVIILQPEGAVQL